MRATLRRLRKLAMEMPPAPPPLYFGMAAKDVLYFAMSTSPEMTRKVLELTAAESELFDTETGELDMARFSERIEKRAHEIFQETLRRIETGELKVTDEFLYRNRGGHPRNAKRRRR